MVYLRQHAINLLVNSTIPFSYWGKWRKKIIKVKINDAKFYVRVGTSDKLILWEIWKRKEYFDKRLNIHSTDIVVDIGAHIGLFSVYAGQKASKGEVFSFEANPNNFNLLNKNIALNKLTNVRTEQIAITNHNSTAKLYFGGRNIGASSLYNGAYRKHSLIAPCMSLDAVIDKYNLRRIDFLKIDVEGSEFDILLSTSSKNLKKIRVIALEYHDHMGLPHSSKELIAFLTNKGFTVRYNSTILNRVLFHTGILIAQRQ